MQEPTDAAAWDDLRHRSVVAQNLDFLTCLHTAQHLRRVIPQVPRRNRTHEHECSSRTTNVARLRVGTPGYDVPAAAIIPAGTPRDEGAAEDVIDWVRVRRGR